MEFTLIRVCFELSFNNKCQWSVINVYFLCSINLYVTLSWKRHFTHMPTGNRPEVIYREIVQIRFEPTTCDVVD